jgi:hypothetical protein
MPGLHVLVGGDKVPINHRWMRFGNRRDGYKQLANIGGDCAKLTVYIRAVNFTFSLFACFDHTLFSLVAPEHTIACYHFEVGSDKTTRDLMRGFNVYRCAIICYNQPGF